MIPLSTMSGIRRRQRRIGTPDSGAGINAVPGYIRDDYGSSQSEFGWWIADLSESGSREMPDLRAFHHRNGFDVTNGVALCHMRAINGADFEMQCAGVGRQGMGSPHALRRSDLDMSFPSKPNSIIAPAINKG
jgi:hypothetical protein